jgi:S1-C subfamily serine protease
MGRLDESIASYQHAISLGGLDTVSGAAVDFAGTRLPALKDLQDKIEAAKREQEAKAEPQYASGTGFYVSTGGDILTNYHVISGCSGLTSAEALRIVFVDRRLDLALLKARTAPKSVATFRVSLQPRLGESLLVYGFPLSGILSQGGVVTNGTVSALTGIGDDVHYFQISAPVQPGNSGGAVLDSSGRVIGVVASKLNAQQVASAIGDIPQNVNFAIRLKDVLSFLVDAGVTPRQSGMIRNVANTSLAESARDISVQIVCELAPKVTSDNRNPK